MKTDLRLILATISEMKDGKISFEEAIENVSERIGIPILDEITVIRDFLCDNNLMCFNRKVRVLNERNYIENGFYITSNNVLPEFINDSLTEECLEMIEQDTLKGYLQNELNHDLQ